MMARDPHAAARRGDLRGNDEARVATLLATAQVEATLALAAATALGTSRIGGATWADVAGDRFGGP